MRITALFVSLLVTLSPTWAFVVVGPRTLSSKSFSLNMAIDYNDPIVAEEFANVQPMTYEEVEEELQKSGIRPSAAMNEMEVKLMLVEMRMRLSGRMNSNQNKAKPTKFSSKLEEYLWTKPAFSEFYKDLKASGDHNVLNVVSEYVNDPKMAQQRYGKDYKAVIRKCQAALTAPPPVKSPTIEFSGFPANMGEAACKMTLEAVGPIVDFYCTESDDLPILTGKVTFEDLEAAKKAVAQYNGMDMGMGTQLELHSV